MSSQPSTCRRPSSLDLLEARRTLDGVVHRTPVLHATTLDGPSGSEVFVKCENLQRTGAFKFRGAYNAVTRAIRFQGAQGVVAYSSGNHALGVAAAARLHRIACHVVVPGDTSEERLNALRRSRARVIQYDRHSEDRVAIAMDVTATMNYPLVAPFDDTGVIAGASTIGFEIMEEINDVDCIVVPVGGGGLLAGVLLAAQAMGRRLRVVGVEPESSDHMRVSLQRGRRVRHSPGPTIADGLWLDIPGRLTFPIIRQFVNDIVTVTDDEILTAMRFGLKQLNQVFEPSGAASLAALLAGRVAGLGKPIAAIITGGNASEELILRSLAKGPNRRRTWKGRQVPLIS